MSGWYSERESSFVVAFVGGAGYGFRNHPTVWRFSYWVLPTSGQRGLAKPWPCSKTPSPPIWKWNLENGAGGRPPQKLGGHRERDTPVRETKGKAIGIHREFGAASKGNEVQYRRALELFKEPTMCFDSDHNYIGS